MLYDQGVYHFRAGSKKLLFVRPCSMSVANYAAATFRSYCHSPVSVEAAATRMRASDCFSASSVADPFLQ